MAVINFDINYFKNLLKKDISKEKIIEDLPFSGFVVEDFKDNELSVEITPNRPDCLSAEGLARHFRGFLDVEKGLPKYKVKKSNYVVKVDDKVSKVRPYIANAVVKNVNLTDNLIKSIMQVQEKIHETLGRKRKKIAIGFYDLDKINFPITYTTTKPEKNAFVPLEFKEKLTPKEILKKHPKGIDYKYTLKGFKEYPMLIDNKGIILSLIPIINSERSKVEADTKNLFIDVTGTDKNLVSKVLTILATMLAEIGGDIYSVKVKYNNESVLHPILKEESMKVDVKYINRLLGLNLNEKEVKNLLQKARMDYIKGKAIYPFYRVDIMHPMDIVEEVAIAYDYRNFEPIIPNIFTTGEEDKLEIFSRRIRELMVGFKGLEVVNYILTNEDWQFKKMNFNGKAIELIESKSDIYNQCKSWLLPGLMLVYSNNKNNEYPQIIFELDDAINPDTGKSERKLAFGIAKSNSNFNEVKSVLISLLKILGFKNVKFVAKNHPSFINGRCAYVKINNEEIGFLGEIHPKVIKNWGLEIPISAFEISVQKLFNLYNKNY